MSQDSSRYDARLEVYQQYQDILQEQAHDPIHGDPVIGAFSQAMHELSHHEETRTLFIDSILPKLQAKDKMQPWYVNNLAVRSVNRCLINPPPDLAGINYPGPEFDKPDTFRAVLADIIGVLSPYSTHKGERFYTDMIWREVQSNKAQRGATLPVLGLMFPDEFKSVTMLDTGTGQMQVPKKLYLGDPFEPIKLVDGTGKLSRSELHRAESAINEELEHQTFELKEAWCTDFFNIKDTEIQEWVEACSLIPKEMRQPGAVEAYRYIQSQHPDNVHFLMSDFTFRDKHPKDPRDSRYTFDVPGLSVDVGTFMTMLYQIPARERRIMFDHMLQYTKHILVQDAAKAINGPPVDHPIDALDIDAKYFKEKWGYRLYCYSADEPQLGMQELLRLDSGRVGEIMLVDTSPMAIRGLKRLIND